MLEIVLYILKVNRGLIHIRPLPLVESRLTLLQLVLIIVRCIFFHNSVKNLLLIRVDGVLLIGRVLTSLLVENLVMCAHTLICINVLGEVI